MNCCNIQPLTTMKKSQVYKTKPYNEEWITEKYALHNSIFEEIIESRSSAIQITHYGNFESVPGNFIISNTIANCLGSVGIIVWWSWRIKLSPFCNKYSTNFSLYYILYNSHFNNYIELLYSLWNCSHQWALAKNLLESGNCSNYLPTF